MHKKITKKYQFAETVSLGFLCMSAICLLAFQLKLFGSIAAMLGLISLIWSREQFRKHLSLLFPSLLILGYFPVTSILKYEHLSTNIVILFITVTSALFLPYLISRYIYKDSVIKFPIFPIKKWSKKRSGYLVFAASTSFILLSVYFYSTHAYLNWPPPHDPLALVALFMGTMFLGVWDELFFVCTVLGITKRYIPFTYANIVQSIIFSSFLYQIGFTSWGFLITFLFTFLQGAVYHKTNSLFYVIMIHLIVDLVLFFMLLYAHNAF